MSEMLVVRVVMPTRPVVQAVSMGTPPLFRLGPIRISSSGVLENQPAGTPIGELSVDNSPSHATWVFFVHPPDNAGGRVAISGDQLLTGLTPIDREETPTLAPQIIAQWEIEAGRGIRVYNYLSIPVLDVAVEPPTAILLSNNQVLAHSSVGAVIGVLSATDPDIGETFTFTLLDDAGGKVAIDGASLEVATDIDIGDGPFDITIDVEDAEGNHYAQSETIEVVQMPIGAIGIWNIADYDASTKSVINSIGVPATPSLNLLRAPRRLFSNIAFYNGAGATVTDDAAVAPDGSNEASTLVGVGNWGRYQNAGWPITVRMAPAGTFTVGLSVKRNTGTDQAFAFSTDATLTRSSPFSATSAWQRHSLTFTKAAPWFISELRICSTDGATDANLQICDFELYEGSSDLGPSTPDGCIYFGDSLYDTRPSFASGALDLSTGGFGLAQLPNAISIGDLTAQALVSTVAIASGIHGFLQKVQSAADFSAAVSNGLVAQAARAGTRFNDTDGTGSAAGQAPGLWDTLNRGWHVFTHRYDGVQQEVWIDDVRLFVAKKTLSPTSIRDLFVNVFSVLELYGGEKYVGIALWDRALSDLELRASVVSWQFTAENSGITATPVDRIVVFEGDSITYRPPDGFPYVFGPNASPAVLGSNFAVPGSALAHLNLRAPYVDAVIPPSPGSRKFILCVFLGANDLNGINPTFAANLAAYCDARRAAGFKVVVCTALPRPGNVNSQRGAVNTEIRTWVGVHADAIADFAADPVMGIDSSFADNPSKWDDNTHPSTAGHVILETIVRPVINGV